MPSAAHAPLTPGEVFGLSPLAERLPEIVFALRGDPWTPPSRFDASSLKVLMPRLAVETWLGRRRADRRIPIYNLYNHTPTPIEQGWSVRSTQVCDFRGRANTYDSHNGTDFAIPLGTVVVAPAPGRVIRVSSEFHRGGLKVCLDHGGGIVTTSNHLGRALVRRGQDVRRGEPIALSGGSGIDMVFAFPWNAPHVHFNVWLDGLNVDPFARLGNDEVSIWRRYNDPAPWSGEAVAQDAAFTPTAWDREAVAEAIAICRDPALRGALARTSDPDARAADVLFAMNYFPTRFERRVHLYAAHHSRRAVLDLPFRVEDFSGIIHLDD